MFKIVFLTFVSVVFVGSLAAQGEAPYKADSGRPGVSIIENAQHERFYANKDGQNIFGKKTFHVALAFACGYAPVQKLGANNEWTYIDMSGNEVVNFTSVGEADSFKTPECTAKLFKVVPSKYQGCGNASICDCTISNTKQERDSSGKTNFTYAIYCAARK